MLARKRRRERREGEGVVNSTRRHAIHGIKKEMRNE